MKHFIANWKMNNNEQDTKKWLEDFKEKSKSLDKSTIIIAPSTPYLHLVKQAGFSVAAQDISLETKGAHTGETGDFQIADFCEYCIVGHSERKEDRETVFEKRDLCLEQKIIPIVCFVEENDALDYYKNGVILAWEDPQNISVEGHYKPRDPQEIRTTINIIKASLPENADVVYGGSVNRQNIHELANIVGLDGVLVGNASLDPEHFYEICKS